MSTGRMSTGGMNTSRISASRMSASRDGREPLTEVRDRIRARVVGRERELDLVLAAVAAGRDILLEGPPGTSKSTLLRAITAEWGIPLVLRRGQRRPDPGQAGRAPQPGPGAARGLQPGQLRRRPAGRGHAARRLPLHRGVQPRARGHAQHPADRHGRAAHRGAPGRRGGRRGRPSG